MTEIINAIITLSSGQHFCLQSAYNATDPEGQPQAGNSYYVGYRCADAGSTAPFHGHQPGQVYPTDGIASTGNAAGAIQL